MDGQLEQRVALNRNMKPSLLQRKHCVRGRRSVTIRAGSDRWGSPAPSGAQGSLTCDWLSASPIADLIQAPCKEFQLWMTLPHMPCGPVTGGTGPRLSEAQQTQRPTGTGPVVRTHAVGRGQAVKNGGDCGKLRAQSSHKVDTTARLQALVARGVWPDLSVSSIRCIDSNARCPHFWNIEGPHSTPAAVEAPWTSLRK